MAAKSFGAGRQKRKVALIFDSSGYRYRDALSDISGQDIASHQGAPEKAIREVRDWLDACRGGAVSLPGGGHIKSQYDKFCRELPTASRKLNLNSADLTYADLCRSIESWFKNNA